MYSISVRTAQNVVIQYPVASVGERILAHLVDRLILVVYTIAVVALFIRLNVQQTWIWIVALLLPWLFFSVLFEIFMDGQTPGKRLMKIQVVRLNGERATIGDFILRWIFTLAEFAILGGVIAVIFVAAGGKGQRLGDLAAGTSVIKLIEQQEITAEEIFITAEENYVPTFNQVIQLNPSDIDLMQRALEADQHHGNSEPLEVLMQKIKSQLGIQTELSPQVFVHTLIKDYNHLTSR
ncbi:RDD family protein [Cytophagales bacterium WSM2-2]|nr:RDD family protein [Cytophagales bacterium WSM2-2]